MCSKFADKGATIARGKTCELRNGSFRLRAATKRHIRRCHRTKRTLLYSQVYELSGFRQPGTLVQVKRGD